MAFMKEIGKKFSDMTGRVRENTETAQIRAQVEEKEKELAEIYQGLGKQYFELKVGEPLPELEELINQAKEKLAQMEELQKVLQKMEAGTVCPACGMQVEEGTLFCVYCGARLATETPAEKHCINCGELLPAEALFCSKCGTKQKA